MVKIMRERSEIGSVFLLLRLFIQTGPRLVQKEFRNLYYNNCQFLLKCYVQTTDYLLISLGWVASLMFWKDFQKIGQIFDNLMEADKYGGELESSINFLPFEGSFLASLRCLEEPAFIRGYTQPLQNILRLLARL